MAYWKTMYNQWRGVMTCFEHCSVKLLIVVYHVHMHRKASWNSLLSTTGEHAVNNIFKLWCSCLGRGVVKSHLHPTQSSLPPSGTQSGWADGGQGQLWKGRCDHKSGLPAHRHTQAARAHSSLFYCNGKRLNVYVVTSHAHFDQMLLNLTAGLGSDSASCSANIMQIWSTFMSLDVSLFIAPPIGQFVPNLVESFSLTSETTDLSLTSIAFTLTKIF